MTDAATEQLDATEIEALARWGFGELRRRDLSQAESIWAQDATDRFPTGDAVGRDAIVAFFEEMFAAFPDIEITVEAVTPAPPRVIVQWRAVGTFTGGRFQGVRPTGRRVEFNGCDVVLVRGKLVEFNHVYWDGAALARQIGMLPREGSPLDRAFTGAFNALTWVRTLGGRRLGGARR